MTETTTVKSTLLWCRRVAALMAATLAGRHGRPFPVAGTVGAAVVKSGVSLAIVAVHTKARLARAREGKSEEVRHRGGSTSSRSTLS